MEEVSARIQAGVERLVEDVDQTVSRPQEKAAYLCCYKCFDDGKRSRESLQHCLQSCRQDVERTEAVINSELSRFQERLQRCALGCQDKAQAAYSPNPLQGSAGAEEEVRRKLEGCVWRCADEELRALPQMSERIKYQSRS